MAGMLIDFNVAYVRNISDNPAIWTVDMDYLRSRVSVNRSFNNERLSLADNRLFEGAKTLIDMLDYSRLVHTNFILNDVHVEIDNDISFPHALLTARVRTFDPATGFPLGPISIHLIYTNVGQRTVNGAFIVALQATRGDRPAFETGLGNTIIRDQFGNVPVLEKYTKLDRPYCYKASVSLRYSENMPTPSEFINDLDNALKDTTEYLRIPETVVKEEYSNGQEGC